jgi:hypothetical protein
MVHKTKDSRKAKKKNPSSCLHPKLSYKRGRTLSHKDQNTKHPY